MAEDVGETADSMADVSRGAGGGAVRPVVPVQPQDNPLNEDDGKAILHEVFRVITSREFGTASEIKIEDLDSIERKFKNKSDRFKQIIRILLENQRTLDELCKVLCKKGEAKLAENITIAVTASRGLIRSSDRTCAA